MSPNGCNVGERSRVAYSARIRFHPSCYAERAVGEVDNEFEERDKRPSVVQWGPARGRRVRDSREVRPLWAPAHQG